MELQEKVFIFHRTWEFYFNLALIVSKKISQQLKIESLIIPNKCSKKGKEKFK